MTFYLYESDGRVTQSVSAADAALYREFLEERGTPHVEKDGPAQDISAVYVDLGQQPPVLAELQPLPLTVSKLSIVADGADTAVVDGAPAGSRLFLNGQDLGEHDGSAIEITAVEARDFHLAVIPAIPFRTTGVTITATEPA